MVSWDSSPLLRSFRPSLNTLCILLVLDKQEMKSSDFCSLSHMTNGRSLVAFANKPRNKLLGQVLRIQTTWLSLDDDETAQLGLGMKTRFRQKKVTRLGLGKKTIQLGSGIKSTRFLYQPWVSHRTGTPVSWV